MCGRQEKERRIAVRRRKGAPPRKIRLHFPRVFDTIYLRKLCTEGRRGSTQVKRKPRLSLPPWGKAERRTDRRAGARSRRVLAFPFGEGGTRSVTDEGMQAAGTALCDALLSSIPHQALRASFPQGKPKYVASRTALPLHRGAEFSPHSTSSVTSSARAYPSPRRARMISPGRIRPSFLRR